ncbi:MAG: ubiquinone-binding protein [Gammaproteobacteria bacterium]|nr:MAG: ubiquinone-binding protein [Gammaproteobacteria bacterium]
MPKISRSALVPYSAEAMFGLVDDIKSYPDFLPWCASSKELARDERGVRGQVELRKGKVHKSFTTQNTNEPGASITMQLVEGPFKKLEGVWSFQTLDAQASKVSLDLEYEFSNVILKMTVGPVFQQIADKLVDAFCQRANDIFGPNNHER